MTKDKPDSTDMISLDFLPFLCLWQIWGFFILLGYGSCLLLLRAWVSPLASDCIPQAARVGGFRSAALFGKAGEKSWGFVTGFSRNCPQRVAAHRVLTAWGQPRGPPKALVCCRKEELEGNDWTTSWAFPNSAGAGSNTKYSFHKGPVLGWAAALWSRVLQRANSAARKKTPILTWWLLCLAIYQAAPQVVQSE